MEQTQFFVGNSGGLRNDLSRDSEEPNPIAALVTRVADSKSKGYEAMQAMKMHGTHFPATTLDTFTVLLIAPTPKRRDTLRDAFKDKPGASLWRFTSVEDLTPENLLHAPVFYPCVGESASLIKKKGN
ncbi:MAG: hypothetical protein ACR2FY_23770 [Pirellulaceae bacterium]